ncbi:hypothetical protein CFIICLFH_0563 [Methylobacterium goesingense]|uniref:Uncharacterized protein n=1 Tax=Methylobacterium goesingense TaxID=243690 RepID=A0ABV2L763_9HYPH|nr:hypothetical protein CFIICLFH_0563 [Methylobacterium goesingense]
MPERLDLSEGAGLIGLERPVTADAQEAGRKKNANHGA